MTKAGIIGLGHIGAGVGECLARAGLLEAIYDVRAETAGEIKGGPVMSASPADVARHCDVVLIAVVSADQTIDVLNGPNGLLAAARSDLTLVLLSTVAIDDLKRIRALTDAAGVGLVDCGVTGGQTIRQNGLVCLVGAEPERLAQVKPILEGFAKSVHHMGGPGAGMAAKIARNVVVYGCFRAGYEGAALARAAGIDVAELARAIEDSTEGVGGPMLLMARPLDARSTPEALTGREYVRMIMNKDLKAALDLAKAVDVSLPLAELTLRTDRITTGLDQE